MKILFLHLSDMHFEEKKRKIIKMITSNKLLRLFTHGVLVK